MRLLRPLVTVFLATQFALVFTPNATASGNGAIAFAALGPTGSDWGQVGKVSTVAVDWANPSVIYAAGGGWSTIDSNADPNSSGVYLTRDGGRHWSQVSAGLPDPFVYSLWVDSSAPNHAVAVSVLGVSETSNWGRSWTMTLRSAEKFTPYMYPTSFISDVGTLGRSLYVANGPSIYRSTNDGQSWSIDHSLSSGDFVYLASNGAEVCATWSGGNIDCSTSPGTWFTKSVTSCGASCDDHALWLGPASAHEIVVGTGAQWMSLDGGTTWRPFPHSALWGGGFQAFTLDPQHPNVCWAADVDGALYKSTDYGAHWTQAYSGGDMRSIIPPPVGSHLFFLGTDQGLYRGNGTSLSSVTPISSGIRSSMVYDVAGVDNELLAITQDYSPLLSTDAGQTWTSTEGGESGIAYINPAAPQVILQSTNNFGATSSFSDVGSRFLNGPSTPQPTGFTSIVNGASTPNVEYGLIDDSYVYPPSQTGTSFLWRSTNWGVTWKKVEQLPGEMIGISVDPSNTKYLVAIQKTPSGNTLWRSVNGGQSWSHVSPNCNKSFNPASITWNPSNATQIVTTSQSSTYVCESNDGGRTFTDQNGNFFSYSFFPTNTPTPASLVTIGGNVLNIPKVYFVPGDPRGASYAIVPMGGLFYSPSFGSPWSRVATNLVVRELTSLTWLKGRLVLSTYGEGVVESTRVLNPFRTPTAPACLATTTTKTTTTFHWRATTGLGVPPLEGFVISPLTPSGRQLVPLWASPSSRSLTLRVAGSAHLRATISSDNVVGASKGCAAALS